MSDILTPQIVETMGTKYAVLGIGSYSLLVRFRMRGLIVECSVPKWSGLSDLLEKIEGITIDTSWIHTNIVTASVEKLGISIEEFLSLLDEKGVKAKRISSTSFRMVAHYGVETEDIEYVSHCISQIAEHCRK